MKDFSLVYIKHNLIYDIISSQDVDEMILTMSRYIKTLSDDYQIPKSIILEDFEDVLLNRNQE